MAISRKVSALKEPLSLDLQLIAAELDTSVACMKYLSEGIMEDSILVESFSKLLKDIESNASITAFDDDTMLYEYLDEPVIIHRKPDDTFLIFDSMITQKIELKLTSYN